MTFLGLTVTGAVSLWSAVTRTHGTLISVDLSCF
jgi:hypothetical protein